jgi:anthranilate 1,2-dioxygenase (deaminating, decarboxylating) large subunit
MSYRIGVAVVCMWIALAAGLVQAQALPSVNLGFTSFMDGGPPAGPGFYYQQYLTWITSGEQKNNDGDTISFPRIDVLVSLNQFIYQSDQPILFGGKWGVDVIVPVVSTHINEEEPGPLNDGGYGLGDVLVGPFLQWDPIMTGEGENARPLFVHRIEVQTIFPTGKYDDDDALNPGANVYSINPYWAATLWITPKWTASWRIHYLWNSENDDPWVGYGAGVNDVQPGQAIHANFATSYEILPKQLRAGFNGYFLKQITDSQINGADQDFQSQVLGLGPGAMYSFSENDHIFVNAYWETLAEDWAESFRIVLRWTHHF